jgi:hypothetical protein
VQEERVNELLDLLAQKAYVEVLEPLVAKQSQQLQDLKQREQKQKQQLQELQQREQEQKQQLQELQQREQGYLQLLLGGLLPQQQPNEAAQVRIQAAYVTQWFSRTRQFQATCTSVCIVSSR